MSTQPLNLRLVSVSKPFDCEQKVELKFEACLGDWQGEMFVRIPAGQTEDHAVGDFFSARLVKLP